MTLPPIIINNDKLDLTLNTKFLGLTLDTKLQWGVHIDKLSKKLSSAAYAVKKIKEYSNIQTARIVYFSYIHSLMTYGILLWGNAADSKSIFILQKRAIRFIYGLGPRVSLREHFKSISILTMPCQYIFTNIMYARKNLINYDKNCDIHTFNTRNKNKIILPKTRLSKVSRSFAVNCVRFYNILPAWLTQMRESIFKTAVKRMLLWKAYYSIQDFINDKKAWQNVDDFREICKFD